MDAKLSGEKMAIERGREIKEWLCFEIFSCLHGGISNFGRRLEAEAWNNDLNKGPLPSGGIV